MLKRPARKFLRAPVSDAPQERMVHLTCSVCGAYGPGVVVKVNSRTFSDLESEIRRLSAPQGWETVYKPLEDPMDLCPKCSGNLMRYVPLYFDTPSGPAKESSTL